MTSNVKEPLFIVYPKGYGTFKEEPIYTEEKLDTTDMPSTACISSTSYYERKLSNKSNTLSERWKIKKLSW